MARATRRKAKVQNSENSQNENAKAAEDTENSESTTTSDRPKRNAKLNNKSWQDLIPKSRKSAGNVGQLDTNNEEIEIGEDKVEDDEEDMADRVKKNRRSVVKDISSTNDKSEKQKNKAKKGTKRSVTKKDVSGTEDSKDKEVSQSDEVTEVIKPSRSTSRRKPSKQSFETTADEVAGGVKASRKKVSKESIEAADSEGVDDAKRGRKGKQEKDEMDAQVDQESRKTNRNSKVRQTRSANSSNVEEQVKKPRHSKSKVEEVKDLKNDKKVDEIEVKGNDKNEDKIVVRTLSRRSSSRIEKAQLEENKKVNLEEDKNEKENEDIFTKVVTKKQSVARQSKVLIKAPPKQYISKQNTKQKLPPKKSLASKDILNLLSDEEDDNYGDELDEVEKQSEKGTALKDKTNTLSAQTKRLTQSTLKEAFGKTPQVLSSKISSPRKSINKFFTSRSLQNSPNPSESLPSRKVPVWKKVAHDSTSVSKAEEPVHDVFNMDCYGEEEFGPEDPKAKKKKRAPRKKVTKGILVFGGNTKKQVKKTCNLKTPGDQNKRKKRIVNVVEPQNSRDTSEINSAPIKDNLQVPHTRNNKQTSNRPDCPEGLEVPKPTHQNENPEASFIRPQTSLISDRTPMGLPQPRRIEMDSNLSQDFSTGAQAYFDSNAGNDHTDQGDDDYFEPPPPQDNDYFEGPPPPRDNDYFEGPPPPQDNDYFEGPPPPHGDNDYFEGPPPPSEDPMANQSGLFGQSVVEPLKCYKTPAIPRHMTKLQTKNASTPRMDDRVQPKQPVTVKEQIKNAFGFDDSTDEEETDGESFAISPVRKVADPVLALLNSPSNSICGATSRLSTIAGNRLSNFSTSSRLSLAPKGGFLTSSINAGHKTEEKKDGPFRFTMGPSSNALLAARLVAQAKKMPPKFSKPLPKSASSSKQINLKQTKIPESISQQTSKHLKVPLVTYGNKNDKGGDEEVENVSDKAEKQKVKKMVKKAPKIKHPDPDESSLLEEPQPSRSKPVRNAAKEANERLEEISKSPENEKSPNKENSPEKRSRPVAKTYVKRNVSKISKPGVSFDESIPHTPPKKPKIQEKKLNQWAALQTSHFSEVDDFDLSFA